MIVSVGDGNVNCVGVDVAYTGEGILVDVEKSGVMAGVGVSDSCVIAVTSDVAVKVKVAGTGVSVVVSAPVGVCPD